MSFLNSWILYHSYTQTHTQTHTKLYETKLTTTKRSNTYSTWLQKNAAPIAKSSHHTFIWAVSHTLPIIILLIISCFLKGKGEMKRKKNEFYVKQHYYLIWQIGKLSLTGLTMTSILSPRGQGDPLLKLHSLNPRLNDRLLYISCTVL